MIYARVMVLGVLIAMLSACFLWLSGVVDEEAFAWVGLGVLILGILAIFIGAIGFVFSL